MLDFPLGLLPLLYRPVRTPEPVANRPLSALHAIVALEPYDATKAHHADANPAHPHAVLAHTPQIDFATISDRARELAAHVAESTLSQLESALKRPANTEGSKSRVRRNVNAATVTH